MTTTTTTTITHDDRQGITLRPDILLNTLADRGLLLSLQPVFRLTKKRCQHRSRWRYPMKLRRNEYCPIHRSVFCCGRERARKERTVRLGVQRIEDTHHPRGYRELRSPAQMRKLLNRKIVEQDRKCAICHEEFTDYSDVVPEPYQPKPTQQNCEHVARLFLASCRNVNMVWTS